MLHSQIFFVVIILGLFRQPFANAKSAAVSTPEKLTIDTKNIKKSDIGFSVQKNLPKCACPDVDLTEEKPKGKISYIVLDFVLPFTCCTNCVSVISAPPGYQVEVTAISVQFQNDSKASLTLRNGRGNDGSVLGKIIKSKYVTFILSAVNAMTVTFSTSNIASSCRYVYYTVTAKLHKLPTSSPVNYLLSSDQPFHLITDKDLNSSNRYWTIAAETGKQVHLYLYGSMTAWFEGNILVIDGTDVNGTVISQVTQLSASSNEPLTVSSSSDGFLTILLDFAPYSSHMDVNFLFTQLENDPSQCGTSKLVYLSSDNDPAVKVSISNHDGGTASCPAVLVTNAQYSPGMQLNINSLQGSMVLYGGVDYQQSSNNEIRRFSSMDDVSSPLRAGGRIFLVQLNPGSMINLSFRTLPYCKCLCKGNFMQMCSNDIVSCADSAVNDDVSGFGQVKFATNYGVGERYSPGLSRTWVRIIGGAVLVVAASFIRCLVRQCREQPEQNDVNSTVPSVHFVSSQPNEGDPLFQQSPSAEAMK